MILIANNGISNESEYLTENLTSEDSVYEIIRVTDGIALFCEDHFTRLQNSFDIKKIPFEFGYDEFRLKIAQLVELNQIIEGNVKFSFSGRKENIRWAFSFVPHNYPSQEDYINGVSTDLLFAERVDPNAKVIQNIIREKATQMILIRKLYEVLLVDRDGLITEGSRSNVFFMKDGIFYTAPASKVLEGITRKKVLWCLNELSFSLIVEAVSADDISNYDAAFLTGTSPGVLPIRLIGKHEFNTSLPAVTKLIERYNALTSQYIQSGKSLK